MDESLGVYKNHRVIVWRGGSEVNIHTVLEIFRHYQIEIHAICDTIEELKEQIAEQNCMVQIGYADDCATQLQRHIMNQGISLCLTYEEGVGVLCCMRELELDSKYPNLLRTVEERHELGVLTFKMNLDTTILRDFERKTIFLCNAPKTGDKSLNKTFEKNNITYLNSWHLAKAFNTNALMNYYKPFKIITAVREPISQNVSILYQLIGEIHRNFGWVSRLIGIDKVMDVIYKGGGDFQKIFDLWVDAMGYTEETNHPIEMISGENSKLIQSDYALAIQYFLPFFGKYIIDITQYPFDQQKGYAIIREGNLEVFVYQIEKLNYVVDELSEWIGVEFQTLERDNEASNKWIAGSYQQAQDDITFSKEYFDRCFAEPYVQHCYSQEDIAKFKEKWKGHIRT